MFPVAGCLGAALAHLCPSLPPSLSRVQLQHLTFVDQPSRAMVFVVSDPTTGDVESKVLAGMMGASLVNQDFLTSGGKSGIAIAFKRAIAVKWIHERPYKFVPCFCRHLQAGRVQVEAGGSGNLAGPILVTFVSCL